MKFPKKIVLLCGAVAFVPVGLFFATARYGGDGHGIHFVSRPPLLSVSYGPGERFIIQDGLNLVPDRTPHAMAGNFVEFGLPFSDSRVSMRFFSLGWWDYEYQVWRSNRATVASHKK